MCKTHFFSVLLCALVTVAFLQAFSGIITAGTSPPLDNSPTITQTQEVLTKNKSATHEKTFKKLCTTAQLLNNNVLSALTTANQRNQRTNISFALKKKIFVFANNLFNNAITFDFFESVILFDKKIQTVLADNCRFIRR